MQRFWPRYPRHRRAGYRIPDLLQWPRTRGGRHKWSGARASLLPPTSLLLGRPSLSTQLTANLQVVAGIISLLNDWRISTGQEPLGFLNLWLYGRCYESHALNDITRGSNPGCGTPGFSAIAGWDPVSSTRLVTSSLSKLDDLGHRRSRVLERLTSAKCWRRNLGCRAYVSKPNQPMLREIAPYICHERPVTHSPMQSYGRNRQPKIPDLNCSLTRYALVHGAPHRLIPLPILGVGRLYWNRAGKPRLIFFFNPFPCA